MKNRWYDADPTVSMAMSLLKNASGAHQDMAARYVLRLLEKDILLHQPQAGPLGRLEHMFPKAINRDGFEPISRRLLEVMKELPPDRRQEMSMNLINYIYMLDCDAHSELSPGDPSSAASE